MLSKLISFKWEILVVLIGLAMGVIGFVEGGYVWG